MASLARTARTALADARTTAPSLRAALTTVSHTLDTSNVPEPLLRSGQHIPAAALTKASGPPKLSARAPKPSAPSSPHARSDIVTQHITPSIRHLLPLLHTQPAHYITAHIHGHPYLLTAGDTLRLPFLMPHVKPGDILRLNRATHIGSRDYTLKAPATVKGNADHGKQVFYLDERLFTCRARVVGIETEPLRVEEKTKRRQRHVKHVFSKMRFTVLKISDLEVRGLEEYEKIVGGK
ncbi:hypothetical protein P153DRAFT_364138 [Dothidotthia symphoricarpi CBS 119687]|uniref:Large ribosomal subunit protein bL21m n=1 Tax=Dothidotthia symphoricarpi CBS 119687 TaxID=1392245 RepID=A0A6A6ALL3_9PLEO|nr:uncharacterized protein P153DRAFT_364138 [Dothidotthia symphoricarpi CBS 119687]KAF2132882.1 hypothetical protein P153DRAFT_364138 [Dothidotthia symphoricarpi CBS 119687]